MTELSVLQAVRLKGRVSSADLADTLSEDQADIDQTVADLAASGLLVAGPTVRITPQGRERLKTLLTEERTSADAAALAAVYDEFRSVNTEFKALVTDWQLKGGLKTGQSGTPNAHDDPEYDGSVLSRLDDLHERAMSIIAAAAAQLPRLAMYSTKLGVALDKVTAGDIAWLTRPLIDSYHTVWFELHEELIVAIGLTREEAARSGDAQ